MKVYVIMLNPNLCFDVEVEPNEKTSNFYRHGVQLLIGHFISLRLSGTSADARRYQLVKDLPSVAKGEAWARDRSIVIYTFVVRRIHGMKICARYSNVTR